MAGNIKKHPKGVLCKYSNSLELTFTKQAGMSLEAISEALTHSDTGTTQIYVNTSNIVPMAVGEFALKSLKQ
ncbi:hypothetical protein SORA22_03140 [Streptococcus oralis]